MATVQETAEERAKREHQETMNRLAKANAIRVSLGPLDYSFIRISDRQEIERLEEEKRRAAAAGSGGGISDSPSIVTNIDDKDGTFKVRDKEGIEIPGVLLYVQRGEITCSVPAYLFEQKHADMMIAKALENGKDLVLRAGGIAGYDQQGNPQEPDWSKLGKPACKRALKNLDMLIKAANKLGQPYELSPGSISLLKVLDEEKLHGKLRPHVEKSKNRVEAYTKAQVEASKSADAKALLLGATRDGSLNKHKEIIAQQSAITNPATLKTDVSKLPTDEQLGAVAKRLEEIEKRAETAEAAAKEVEASVDGAAKLLDHMGKSGSAIFANTGLIDVIQKMQAEADKSHPVKAHRLRVEAQELGIEDAEKHRLQRAEAVVENLKERFDPAATSSRAVLQAEIGREIKQLKEQANACKELVDDVEKVEKGKVAAGAALDPDMQKRITELQKKAEAMDKRAEAMAKAQADVDKKAKDIPTKVKDAQDKLEDDKDKFEAQVGRRPEPR